MVLTHPHRCQRYNQQVNNLRSSYSVVINGRLYQPPGGWICSSGHIASEGSLSYAAGTRACARRWGLGAGIQIAFTEEHIAGKTSLCLSLKRRVYVCSRLLTQAVADAPCKMGVTASDAELRRSHQYSYMVGWLWIMNQEESGRGCGLLVSVLLERLIVTQASFNYHKINMRRPTSDHRTHTPHTSKPYECQMSSFHCVYLFVVGPPLWSSGETDPDVPGAIPGATRFSEKWWVWNGVHSASWG
jgi:hypothetical protein